MRRVMFLIPILMLLLLSCETITTEKIYSRGLVVSSDRIASKVGLEILKQGGNAIDAACATALALAVTYPRAGNLGGGGFAVLYSADSQKVSFLDFRETAPRTVDVGYYLDSLGQVVRTRAVIGPASAGTPGTVAGLYEMQLRFGKLKWGQVVHPARMLADTGFVVGDSLAASLAEYAEDLTQFPSTAETFVRDGRTPKSGEQFKQNDLALTLVLIEEKGRDGFYLGETAQKIADYCQTHNGFITLSDLETYQPVWRAPINFKFAGLDIYTAPLPSSGGVVMGQILKTLDRYELSQYSPLHPEYIHLFTEAARLAYADREAFLGDPAFTPDYSSSLLDEAYLASRMKSIKTDRATPSEEIRSGIPKQSQESDNTTHLVAADSDGNIVSLTYTINLNYGSKAVVAGAGFLLNNEMDDFAIAVGQSNAFGLIGGEANKIEAGKRMLSSMSPTIILKSHHPYLALGSRGGSKIITAVAQTIINFAIFGESLPNAIGLPRFHHQWQPDKLFLEQDSFSPETIHHLQSLGHNVVERDRYSEVMGISFSADGKFFSGTADSRGPGFIAGY